MSATFLDAAEAWTTVAIQALGRAMDAYEAGHDDLAREGARLTRERLEAAQELRYRIRLERVITSGVRFAFGLGREQLEELVGDTSG